MTRIRALCVVKDEADVVVETLLDAARWCDEIHVLDNGSTDGTWELVNDLARRERIVRPWRQDDRPFTDGIRALLFAEQALRARIGDWWVRLDADEQYVGDPRDLLAEVAPECFSVWSASLSYYLTDRDLDDWRADPEGWSARPVGERLRHYLNHWSEPRFFRHEHRLRWTVEDGGFPSLLWRRPAAPQRVLVRHFAYRSPEQVQRRLDARRPAYEATGRTFSHEAIADWPAAVAGIRAHGGFAGRPGPYPDSWTERVVPAAALDVDHGDGDWVLNPDLMPSPPPPPGTGRRAAEAARRALARVRAS